MSGTKAANMVGVKRKRETSKADRSYTKTKIKRKLTSAEANDPQASILHLETKILESRRHYNNIAVLLNLAKQYEAEHEKAILPAVALCRVFSRLLSIGDMVKSKGMPESEAIIVQWLKERYRDFTDLLLDQYLRSRSASTQLVALTLLMRLVKEESKAQNEYNWKQGPLPRIITTLLSLSKEALIRDEFAEEFLKPFDDIRFYTFQSIRNTIEAEVPENFERPLSSNALSLLMALDEVPTTTDSIQNFFTESRKSSGPVPSLSAYKSHAQDAWLAALRSGIDREQRKNVLRVFASHIAPWFHQPEILMDFLTDSYDIGGGTSLLALSGLYYLISEKNLDYPSFYQKLYSLLDEGLLHSKHRSRFFRLLDTFMSSTHLPAALVASFIKRLSRLALYAPPAGIVVVVPWIYNLFKRHPTCTFMMHREIRDPHVQHDLDKGGMNDPFRMEEEDPMVTNAIDSSVWELETLQSHYHPNVATLAKVISEQFTKRSYNLEDFLDHSYSALLDSELSRDLKKEPVVEYEIPKRIFIGEEDGLKPLGQLMMQVIESVNQ